GLFPMGDTRTVGFGDDALKTDDTVGGGAAFLIAVLLDGHRNAMQRSEVSPAFHGRIGVACGLARRSAQIDGHGIELWVDLCHALQARLERLARRDLPPADRGSDSGRAPAPD